MLRGRTYSARERLHERGTGRIAFSSVALSRTQRLRAFSRCFGHRTTRAIFRGTKGGVAPGLLLRTVHALPRRGHGTVLLCCFRKVGSARVTRLFGASEDAVRCEQADSFRELEGCLRRGTSR